MTSRTNAVGRSADGSGPATPAPMLTVDTLADMLGVSSRHVRRLVDAGKCPQPVRLGRSCRWPRPVVERWISDNCPNCRKRPGVSK